MKNVFLHSGKADADVTHLQSKQGGAAAFVDDGHVADGQLAGAPGGPASRAGQSQQRESLQDTGAEAGAAKAVNGPAVTRYTTGESNAAAQRTKKVPWQQHPSDEFGPADRAPIHLESAALVLHALLRQG